MLYLLIELRRLPASLVDTDPNITNYPGRTHQELIDVTAKIFLKGDCAPENLRRSRVVA